MSDNSLVFFDYDDFVWEFSDSFPMGSWVGSANKESIPPFDDFHATIRLTPRRKTHSSPISFGVTMSWWIDDGNHGSFSTSYPPFFGVYQTEDADLEEAKRWAYDRLNHDYSRLEYHLMP